MRAKVFDRVLDVLGLLEAVGCGYLVIEIDLFLVEDEDVASGDDIALRVHQIASSIDQTAIFVVKLAIGCL